MRKWIFSLIVAAFGCLTITTPGWAQYPSWEAIVYAGATDAHFTGAQAKSFVGNDRRQGFAGGVSFFLRTDKEFGVETGIRYAQKGGGGTFLRTFAIPNFKNVTAEVGTGEFRFEYIEVPLLFAGILDIGSNSHVRGYVGPSLNFLIRANLKGTIEGQSLDENVTDQFSDFDLGGNVGVAYRYSWDRVNLHVDGRWMVSMRSIEADETADPDIKNNVWTISVGLGFMLAVDDE